MKTQKELKAEYTEELRKVWNDEKMVAHCSRSTAFIVEHNGALYGIDKPRIETRFCFGYGINGISDEEDEDRATAMARTAQESKEYFIKENLEDIDQRIAKLNKILEEMRFKWVPGDHPRYMVATGAQYYRQPEDCKLRYYSIVDTFYGGKISGELCSDTELVEKLIIGYEAARMEFVKRLNTYLKRYGLSKVETWSYLRD